MATAGNKAKAVDVGHLEKTRNTTSVGPFTAETVTDSITATLESGQDYDIYTDMLYNSSVANDDVQVRIREDTIAGTSLLDSVFRLPNTGRYYPGPVRVTYTAVSDGAKTFVVTAARSAGSGNITRYGAAGRPAQTWLDKT